MKADCEIVQKQAVWRVFCPTCQLAWNAEELKSVLITFTACDDRSASTQESLLYYCPDCLSFELS